MLTYWQAIILGILQGVSELFPISSLGHSVIFPRLVGWHINQNQPFFLTFLVTTHLATALVLIGFFWKDWIRICAGFFRSLKEREIRDTDHDAKLAWMLIVGTIPAGLLGVLFEDKLKTLFASPQISALFLFFNGIMLLVAEVLRRKRIQTDKKTDGSTITANINWFQAVGVGTAQAIALFPGFSRTGSTITGGLLAGLSHEDAARFSFYLATPIIFAAALLKVPDLFTSSEQMLLGPAIVGALFAGISAFFSVKFLTRYFKTHNLFPFGIYCIVIGLGVSLVFLFTH